MEIGKVQLRVAAQNSLENWRFEGARKFVQENHFSSNQKEVQS